MEGSQNSK